MEGVSRDIFTPQDGSAARILAEGRYRLNVSASRAIEEIDVTPEHPRASEMIGIRGGGDSRTALGTIMGDVRGTPLYQILDDFAGASLVSNWAWSLWVDDWIDRVRGAAEKGLSSFIPRNMTNVCTGFAEGSSALSPDGLPGGIDRLPTNVGSLINPADLEGWHVLPEQSGVAFRRARRIDLWREGDQIKVDVGFQDSGPNKQGGRCAIHEYQAEVTVHTADMTVKSIDATPRILPFRECPGAIANIRQLVGHPVGHFRQDVLNVLPGPLGCTHLNDVLRALADVPPLAASLD